MGWGVDFAAYLIKKFAPFLSASIARHFSTVSLKSNDVIWALAQHLRGLITALKYRAIDIYGVSF
jgi:hypothetical protein